ncbi:MAG: TolC family protein [Bacteroidetes bacterium]|nr:TolC family protein [Bacteroidota bacterium]MCL5737886.1 TolC family protein [Bacteroidota bacterium]
MKFKQVLRPLFVTCVLLLATQAQAQVKPLSLSDYLSAALKYNPLLGSAEQVKASAKYRSEAIRKSYYPQIGIGSHLIVAPGYDPAITNGGEFGAQISGSYTIYDGGARGYEIRKGGVGVEQGTLNQSRTKADIIYSVSTAFVAALKEKRELDVVKQGYNLLDNYLQLVRQLQASGQGSETDVLKTTVDLNNALIDINIRKVSSANSLLALAQAAGLPSNEVTDVDSSSVSISYDTTFHAERSIDLQSQALILKQADLEANIANSRLKPIVSVGADAGALTSLPNVSPGLPNVFGASVGISVSVPVFTLGSLQDSYMAAEANAKSISLHNDYTRNFLGRNFQATKNDIARAKSEIDALKKNLVVAQQNYLLSKAKYAVGSGLSLDVLDAIQKVNQIRLAIEEARAQMEMSVLKLNRLNYSEGK